MRIYVPDMTALDSWQPPVIQRTIRRWKKNGYETYCSNASYIGTVAVLRRLCAGWAQRAGRGKDRPGSDRRGQPATDFTAKANAAVYDELDFDDKREYEFATRGLIDAPETLELKDEDGNILWSQEAYAFLDDYEKAPDSVNPSLWENTKNNHAYGPF